MRRTLALLFAAPALAMGGLLARDLAHPAGVLAYHARAAGVPANVSDLPARATGWAGPLSRLRDWAGAAGVESVNPLLALAALALFASAAVSLWAFWSGSQGAWPRGEGSAEPPGSGHGIV